MIGNPLLKAFESVIRCLPLLFQPRPGTPLRVLCISAFDYLGWAAGRDVEKKIHNTLAMACDLGAIVNLYYDQGVLDRVEYRFLRKALRKLGADKSVSRHLKEIRRLERNRPCLCDTRRVVAYRSQVIEQSLFWLWSIAARDFQDRRVFDCFLPLVELIQLVDDLLDWKDDWADRLPTYVTAYLENRANSGEEYSGNNVVRRSLRALAREFRRNLVIGAKLKQARPFLLAGTVPWFVAILLCQQDFR